jgi:general secretion pathway protein K
MNHVSELLLIQGMTQDDFGKLLPHVTVLPPGRATINVNTATEEVLLSLSGDLNQALVKRLVEARESKAWETIESFRADPALVNVKLFAGDLGVSSNFFEVATKITLGDRTERLVSLIYRKPEDGSMQTLSRDQSQKYLITKERVAL